MFTTIDSWEQNHKFQSRISQLQVLRMSQSTLEWSQKSVKTFSLKLAFSVPSDAISTRLSTCLGEALELTFSICILSPNGFLIHSKLVSKSQKYIPNCEDRACKCCLRDATELPSMSSSLVRIKSTSVRKLLNTL